MRPIGSINIGSLLLQAELVFKADLDNAISLSKKMKLPVGRVLVSTGFITDETLTAALEAQSHIREKTITQDVAIKALKEAHQNSLNFNDVLLEYGLNAAILDYTNKLGQLLVDSEFITERQRLEALKMALASNLPLGRILVMQKAISNMHAYAALSAQILIRTGEISRDQAIEALAITREDNCPLETALKEKGFIKSESFGKIMLGELLMISNQLSEVRFLTSLEQSLIENAPLGKVLVDLNYLSEDQLQRALSAQKQIADGSMDQRAAIEFIKHGQAPIPHPEPEATAASEIKMSLGDLMVLCKLISAGQLVDAVSMSTVSGVLLSQMLELSGMVHAQVLIAASAFLEYHNEGLINAEELILSMNLWLLNPQKQPQEIVRQFAQPTPVST